MRTTIIPNIMELLSRNFNYGVKEALTFEIGNIFIPKELPLKSLPQERRTLAIGMYGEVDYYGLKGIVEILLNRLGISSFRYLIEENQPTFDPGRTANIILDNKVLGIIGEVHPDVLENYDLDVPVYIGELDFVTIIEEANLIKKINHYRNILLSQGI